MANLQRRDFLAGSLAAAAVSQASANGQPAQGSDQELIELRAYRHSDAAKQSSTLLFAATSLLPALKRQGIERIGIFESTDESDASIYLVIPYSSPEQLTQQNDLLEADRAYHETSGEHFAHPMKDPAYTRIESRLMRGFKGMPKVIAPTQKSPDRLVELRIYEAHNAHLARRKVEMFNEGEIEVMQEVGLAPVFFGETLISDDVPNLSYMLSADSADAHKEHWQTFLAHPEWNRMKNLKRYANTVSKIQSITMRPAPASQL